MHEPWEDLIPFYVAGTLSPQEAEAFERHLATCEDCHESLAEWRAIAQAVQDYAERDAGRLPPLSVGLLANLPNTHTPSPTPVQPLPVVPAAARPVEPPVPVGATVPLSPPPLPARVVPRQPAPNRSIFAALGAAAAVLVIGVLGLGVLVVANLGQPTPTPGSAVAVVASDTPDAVTFTPTPARTRPTPEPTIGIITPTLLTSTRDTATLPPAPPAVVPTNTTGAAATEIDANLIEDPSATGTGCEPVVVSTGSLTVYSQPNENSVTLTTLSPGQEVPLVSDDGTWKQIRVNGTIGYARSAQLTTVNPCGPITNAELVGPQGFNAVCTATLNALITSGTLSVYTAPARETSIVGNITTGNEVTVLSRVDNGWVEIRFTQLGLLRTGYVVERDLVIPGDGCPTLPLVAASALLVPTPTPVVLIPTFTPLSPPGSEVTAETP